MENATEKVYRRNVAIVVLDDQGLLLACHRNDRDGIWQLPQGGIEDGEANLEAMYRELAEEIGTADVTVIGCLSESIRYDWPEDFHWRGFHGQEQVYYLVRLNPSATIDLFTPEGAEFDKYEWLPLNEFISRLTGFKRDVYVRALAQIDREFPQLLRRS